MTATIGALIFLSGFTGLAYQVLWLKDLALVFGNTTHAAAVGLAAFFLGLGAGAHVWGTRAPNTRSGLRAYGWLEVGIGASALLVPAVLQGYRLYYPSLHARAGDSLVLLVALKSALAIGCLFVPTFLMGGTMPFVAQAVVARPRAELARAGALLYAINTIGAASGAAASGFFLPVALGFRGAYLLAVAISIGVGLWALRLGRATQPGEAAPEPGPARTPPSQSPRAARRRQPRVQPAEEPEFGAGLVGAIAFASGLLTLGLEVVWVRMFAQVLDNSVYAFSAILVVFLAALGAGSLLASRLVNLQANPRTVLALILAMTGVLVAAQPFVFVYLTDGLRPVTSAPGSQGIIWTSLRLALWVLLPAGVAAGTVFPYLLRLAQGRATSAGFTVGRLTALNTAGAIVGSLATGFWVVQAAGLWGAFIWCCAAYLALAFIATQAWSRRPALRFAAATAAAVAIVLIVDVSRVPVVWLDSSRGERLLEVWQGGHGIVSVVDSPRGRLLKLDNAYSLGGTVDRIEREQIQALLPLLIHPRPQSVFFLGLGAGITAGEAVRHPVSRIVVCELVPEVVTAATRHFDREMNGLLSDPRTRVIVDDGRQVLMTLDERFDVIVGDLFVPWHAGTGTLYTREHFQTVRGRLAPGGIFAQWLPLYQLGVREFEVIARTMLEAFPHVAVWRGDFYANRPIVALVGSNEPFRLDMGRLRENAQRLAPDVPADLAEATVLPFYVGNLDIAKGVVGAGPVNTDDRPVVEYWAPVAASQQASGTGGWFIGSSLVSFLERLAAAVPPDRDPYLSTLTAEQRRYVGAGLHYYKAVVSSVANEEETAKRELAAALALLPQDLPVAGPFLSMQLLTGGGNGEGRSGP